MHSSATTVAAYLNSLPAERRAAISSVHDAIRSRMPEGYEEAVSCGMIAWQVPLSVCPQTYNGKPLMYAALASQKHHMAVYLTSVYMDERLRRDFESAYRASGKRMDMGKSCVRFRRLDDLPLDLIVRSIEAMPLAEFVGRVRTAQASYAAHKAR